MRRLLLSLVLLSLAAPSAAQAEWFGAQPVDGPADIAALGDVDLARDGTGGVVYVKTEGGVPQLFLSRILKGAWKRPERITAGAPVTEATVTALDGGRLAIAWVAGGQVFGTVASRGHAPAPAAPLGGGGASGVSIDMGIDEVAYAVWSQDGAGGGDVRAARLQGSTWTPLGPPLDLVAARSAGRGAGAPRVAVSADGNAVTTWGEAGGDGRTHVVARRLTGLAPSSFPQDLTLDSFEGRPAGAADSPDIDIEDDGSFAWVAFRQDAGGRSRTVARRLVGSLFDPPFAIDGGATSSLPRIDFSGRGIGAAVAAAADNAVFSSYLDKFDVFQPGVRIDQTPSGAFPAPVVATSERGDAYVAWRTGAADGSGAVHARRKDGEKGFEPEFSASNPGFGAVPPGQVAMSADRSGNVAVAMLQGGPGARRLAVAVYDRRPGTPVVTTRSTIKPRRPLLKWIAGSENWGRQVWTLRLDGKAAGKTTKPRIRPRRNLRPGLHRWQVVATDRRGQHATSRLYRFRVR